MTDASPPMTRRCMLGAALGVPLAGLLPRPAAAQTANAIRAAGVLRVGSQVAQVPWGFTDGAGKLTGFDIELSELLARDLGVKAEFLGVTPANRTAALLTGQVDVLAAVMGIYPDRQKVVLFSRPYTPTDTVVIGKPDVPARRLADLKGLRVGLARGTPQDIVITKANTGATIQRFDDDASAVQALLSGQVDVVGGAGTQIANIDQVAGAGTFVQKFAIARAYNAFAVRPGSRPWVDTLNDFIARKTASGELEALHRKWIGGEFGVLPVSGEGDAPLPTMLGQ